MNLEKFSNWLVKHPYVILSTISAFSITCIVLPFTIKSMEFPSFQDPQLGFSTRGTYISNRLTAWENLLKNTKPSGLFVKNPKEYLMIKNFTNNEIPMVIPKKHLKRKKGQEQVVYGNVYTTEEKNMSEVNGNANIWKAVQNLTWGPIKGRHRLNIDNFFCGPPDPKYAHFVITSKNSTDLFTLDFLLSLCRLEHIFTELKYYNEFCIQNLQNNRCCKPWSLPNYIAILNQKTSCLTLTEQDVTETKRLLIKCAHYFHNLELNSNCFQKSGCDASIECMRHDAAFNIMNFLTSTNFLPPNGTDEENAFLAETMIFLPLACSSGILSYYHQVEKLDLEFEGLSVVAMDFGLKNSLFHEYLIRDTWLILFGSLFIFVSIWVYTRSIFLTVMTIIVIVFSLADAYFLYFVAYEIKFFPFMNVLTIVVIIGIGADDAFIFCKIWDVQKNDQRHQNSILKIMSSTFHHAFISMLVTALTTAVAFWGSYVSSVTAISCFSIFAGTTVVINYVLMITWFPASLVIWEKSWLSKSHIYRSCLTKICCFKFQVNLFAGWFQKLGNIWNGKKQFFLDAIIKLRYFWIVLLTIVALAGFVVVFIFPKLKVPNSTEFQLFVSEHPFEKYDFIYKTKFWFGRGERESGVDAYKMPMRFVWGVLPVDNGDHLNPSDLGHLVLDSSFDIGASESQEWLMKFCADLREQPFYQSVVGPLLPNCFIETFAKSMKRKCIDPFTSEDLTPCCEVVDFPFNRTIFNRCIIEEMADLYETPSKFLHPQTAGPKFSKDQNPTIKAVVVEYDSIYDYSMSYEQIDKFFVQVNGWMTEVLTTAPRGMKNGFFISDLDFYDLQNELSRGTQMAITVSMGLALAVLFLSTLNVISSILAIIAITFSILVVMAILVIFKWRLNILESTAISSAIGLTVDFSLHYSINYRLCPEELAVNREAATGYALSRMMGPSLMAALTTAAAGGFMMFSQILPYLQIGLFLVLVMLVSWIYSTFLLGALFALFGPTKNQCQYSYTKLLCCLLGHPNKTERRNTVATSSTSDSHELDQLTYIKHDKHTPRRSLSMAGTVKYTPSRHTFTDQSPSATSAITIIMADDN
ncbi:protein dispatched [Cylas formicarius]|uniref:protein dispatched n=1 Tax=Cylas formicarius TaxID=197179 RepID=UPI002958C6F4|nr:protein dispatched [Cylas formicarius]